MSYDTLERAFASADPTGKFQQWTPVQRDAFALWDTLENQRILLFYPTGKGKTKISLAMLRERGYTSVIIIAPVKTTNEWHYDARTAGFDRVIVMSHEKFRMASTKLPKDVPLIVDEIHKLGKNTGVGFQKLDRMAQRFPAIIECSATPNWNDVERVYCIVHTLDPENNRGGFEPWVRKRCEVEYNPYARLGKVISFLDGGNATTYLAALPYCAWIEDNAEWEPVTLDVTVPVELYDFDSLGYSVRHHKMMASDMEARWKRTRQLYMLDGEVLIRPEIMAMLLDYMQSPLSKNPTGKFLVYSMDKTIADAFYRTMVHLGYNTFSITGETEDARVHMIRDQFVAAEGPAVLVGTNAIAEGVDKIDKVCNHLILLVDTNDNSKRRQMIGRILPRGDYKRDTIVTKVVANPVANSNVPTI